MRWFLELTFDEREGRTCEKCEISFLQNETRHCAGIKDNPVCPSKRCREDCPLICNALTLQELDSLQEKYGVAINYTNKIFRDYTENDYKDYYTCTNKEVLVKILSETNKMVQNTGSLLRDLSIKQNAVKSLIEEKEKEEIK